MISENPIWKRDIETADLDPEQAYQPDISRLNPRYLFIDPSSEFGRSFYQDLLMEMQEQM